MGERTSRWRSARGSFFVKSATSSKRSTEPSAFPRLFPASAKCGAGLRGIELSVYTGVVFDACRALSQKEFHMLTRREFLGAGVGVAVAARAFALPGDRMRYAMSGHQFRAM